MDNWNLEGLRVVGDYLEDAVTVSGVVTLSRVAYGGMVHHHVRLDEGFSILNGRIKREAGESVILEHPYIRLVMSGNSVEA